LITIPAHLLLVRTWGEATQSTDEGEEGDIVTFAAAAAAAAVLAVLGVEEEGIVFRVSTVKQ